MLKRLGLCFTEANGVDFINQNQNYSEYSKAIIAKGLERKEELRQDFEQRKLEVWFQPQLDLKTLEIIGCEALLRWPSGNGQYISPAIFVPMAEDAGLIVDIGQWVLEQACLQQKRLEALGFSISGAGTTGYSPTKE